MSLLISLEVNVDITADLNQKQREAVSAPPGSQLVLAGAGSGKTRVLVSRIAWLIQHQQASPQRILAVTFTNKAAAEMRGRLEKILGFSVTGLWVGTFHGLAHRLLRAHWSVANLPEQFQILDSDDQHRLIKRVMKNLELDSERWPPKQAQWFINQQKDKGLRPQHLPQSHDPHTKTWIRIYEAYEAICQQNGVIDFAELLLRAYELWRDNPDLLAHYQDRFAHILVDEFQDTNAIQYAWLKLLATPQTNTMIVGDDDQSIYGWRGAQVTNIKKFLKDFPNPQTIRLEQNYRSTSTILSAANALIDNNDDRMGKSLWTQGDVGEKIKIYQAYNDLDEARYIAENLHQHKREFNYQDMAVLYRSNAQSRIIEEALIQSGIPYRVYGGQRFFERAEIKDALAYLRLLANRHDDTAFERAVNNPPRGIGEKSVNEIRYRARTDQISLWQATKTILAENSLSARAHSAVSDFIALINNLVSSTQDYELDNLTDFVIKTSGLIPYYQKSKGEKAQSKVENLQELITATAQFYPNPEEEITELSAFLSHAALEAGETQSSVETDCVQLMTLHSAKGLEFPVVILAGVEEGLFPHAMSIEEPGRLEEERRLCYVGMTRAMHHLIITNAEVRRLFGRENYHRPSRFLKEIPKEYIQNVRTGTPTKSTYKPTRPAFDTPTAIEDTPFNLGDTVTHPKYGEGMVLNFEGRGPQARVEVNFVEHGRKWLVVAYAKLQTCSG